MLSNRTMRAPRDRRALGEICQDRVLGPPVHIQSAASGEGLGRLCRLFQPLITVALFQRRHVGTQPIGQVVMTAAPKRSSIRSSRDGKKPSADRIRHSLPQIAPKLHARLLQVCRGGFQLLPECFSAHQSSAFNLRAPAKGRLDDHSVVHRFLRPCGESGQRTRHHSADCSRRGLKCCA